MEEDTKILFIHNTITWYRIPLFNTLSRLDNRKFKFLFTKVNLGETQYKIKIDYEKQLDVDYIVLNKKNFYRSFIKILFKYDYDVIIIPVLDSLSECIDFFLAFFISKLRRKKTLYFWERWDPDKYYSFKDFLKKSIKKLIFKKFVTKVNAYIVPGTKTKEYFLKNGANERKIFLAPDASELKFQNLTINVDIKRKFSINNDYKVVLYFGRLMESKGLDYLIKAFFKLKNKYNNVALLICGDGEFRKYCEILCKELKLENVFFCGRIDPSIRISFFRQCDVFVLPSITYKGQIEAWGLTVNEVMECGKPIIVTNAVGCGDDLVKNYKNGFIVKERNENEIFEAMYKILIDDNLRANMCKNSLEIIKNYTYLNMANGFNKAIEYVLDNEI
ncbi:glycosyltransferase family 4 protein [Clostridium neuense]|uniref:Glycosyltransferase family 4 protein n=1 Tax=Clostridium neuense TaxID=1728934 RepID=A0ABW8TBN9_9CLOT